MTLRDKLRICEIRRALNAEPLLRIERSKLRWFGHVSRIPHETVVRQVLLAKPTGKRPRGRPKSGWSDYTSPTLLAPVVVWSQQNYLKLLLTVRYSES